MTWDKELIRDVATFVMGQAPPGTEVNVIGLGTPFFRSGEFEDIRPKIAAWTTKPLRLALPTDVFVCVVGANAGEVNRGADGAIGRSIGAVRSGDRLDHDYLYYFLRSIEVYLRNAAQGSAQAVISKDDLGRIEIPLPVLEEQRAIAGVLGALDDKIESNRRLQLLLDALIEAEFTRATNGSNLVHFGHSLDVVMGAPFGGDHFSEIGNGRPLIRIRDLKTFAPQTWTTESRADEVLVRAGDVVVGMDAEFRSTLWVGEVGLLNQRVCKFVPKAGVATAFAWYAIRSDLEYCERAKSGTTVIHLNKGDIDRFSVPELSPSEHQSFLDLTEPMLKRLVSAGLENLRLAALRDALLPELLSGRLRVKDAASIMETV